MTDGEMRKCGGAVADTGERALTKLIGVEPVPLLRVRREVSLSLLTESDARMSLNKSLQRPVFSVASFRLTRGQTFLPSIGKSRRD